MGCVVKVNRKWPVPAKMEDPVCRKTEPPNDELDAGCVSPTPSKNLYIPITIFQNLVSGRPFNELAASADGWKGVQYEQGADVDTLTLWDRIRCRDGQIFSTGWYKKYTDQECARLCAKICSGGSTQEVSACFSRRYY